MAISTLAPPDTGSAAESASASASKATFTQDPLSILSKIDSLSSKQQHLVLVGGGHAHVQVIKALNKAARPTNLRVTLIDTQPAAWYSGMVPGCLAGFYEASECTINIKRLAEWAGIDYMQAAVIDMDLGKQVIYYLPTGENNINNNSKSTNNNKSAGPSTLSTIQSLSNKPSTTSKTDTSYSTWLSKNIEGASRLEYGLVSLDIGSTSRNLDAVPGVREFTIPTRPIDKLVYRIQEAAAKAVSDTATVATADSSTASSSSSSSVVSVDSSYSQSTMATNEETNLRNITTEQPIAPVHLVVVGSGVAGIELALSMTARWKKELAQALPRSVSFSTRSLSSDSLDTLTSDSAASDSEDSHIPVYCTVLNSGTDLWSHESPAARKALLKVLDEHDIQVIHQSKVERVTKEAVWVKTQAPMTVARLSSTIDMLKSGTMSSDSSLASDDSDDESHDRNDIDSHESDVRSKYGYEMDEQGVSTVPLPYTHCVWATGADAHPLAHHLSKNRNLATTAEGWIKVSSSLQSESHPNVFAAGDCAHVLQTTSQSATPMLRYGAAKGDTKESTRAVPKAGVYAVRAGPILIENLTKQLEQQKKEQQENETSHKAGDAMESVMVVSDAGDAKQRPASLLDSTTKTATMLINTPPPTDLTKYEPQDDFMKLICCGDGKALGFRFGIAFHGKWVFEMKDHIDRKFMTLFDVDSLPPPPQRASAAENEAEDGFRQYDTSQYDADEDTFAKIPLPDPVNAARLIQRTDDNVDYMQAWRVLRGMAVDADYRTAVLARMR
jgi:NADH dehydrogenase FAD-containing subunit